MRPLVLTVVFAALFAGENTPESELERYQGTWVLVSEEFEGKVVPAGDFPDLSYTVRGKQVHFTSHGTDHSAFVAFDPTKVPKTYDLLRDDSVLSVKGIYIWDHENLKICAAEDQGARPTEFKTEVGSRNRIRVWKHTK